MIDNYTYIIAGESAKNKHIMIQEADVNHVTNAVKALVEGYIDKECEKYQNISDILEKDDN